MKIYKEKELQESKINCIPARIKKTYGFILEPITGSNRKLLFDFISHCEKNGYNVYSLRHKTNDWSRPVWLYDKGILIDRFGWYITKETIKFSKKMLVVEDDTHMYNILSLRSTNALYFDIEINKTVNVLFSYTYPCYNVPLVDYLRHEDEIVSSMKKFYNDFSGK